MTMGFGLGHLAPITQVLRCLPRMSYPTAPTKQVGESSLERGDFQTLPSLPKLSLILRDACHPHALHRHKVRCPDQRELSHSKVVQTERERETLDYSGKCWHLIQNTLEHATYLIKV